MDEAKTDYISVIGHRLVAPAITLLDRLFAEPHPGTTDVQTGARENGYSASACMMLVVLLESFVNQARFVTLTQQGGKGKRALDFLKTAYPDCPLLSDVEELFVLRDVIAHNHIWRIQFSTKRGRWMTLLRRELTIGGDKKFDKIVDRGSGLTRKLKLKVVPTLIDRHDVGVVLKTVLATLRFINGREKGRLGIDGLRGDFAGEQDLDLWEIECRIEDRLTVRCSGPAGSRCSPAGH